MPNLKNINWLLVAGIATIAYVFVFVGWLGLDRILIYPTNNSLNEVGDFIAGVFSPLAFIWLVAAVLTQRQELTETRDQFAANQEVVDAQLKTINEQSDLLQQQHTLAEETAKKTYRLSLFEERYKIYEEFIAFGKKYDEQKYRDPAYTDFVELMQKSTFVFGSDIDDWFHEISENIYHLQDLRRSGVSKNYDKYGGFVEIYSSNEVEAEIKKVSNWLNDQFFLAVERSEKFSASMRVSDN
ncbi:hypothetical protein [Agrobacterium pusense]|uniref:hypothetical protein n=1 Tax=Agrobacterium pusense TaxID=648995 RepID=UPI000D36DD90|nr:hypothetical protein [Agrobacterium pusense]PTV69044.1 hypothetical protein DBL06_27830 [Agrobacterium pusense]